MTGRKSDDDEDGQALWRAVTADIKPLNEPAATPPPKAFLKNTARSPVRNRVAPIQPPEAPSKAVPARDLDRRTAQKLARGQMAIDGVIDLHGMTQAEAHEALMGYIRRSATQGLRCVLVITGKGRGGAGVLKTRAPEWLNDPALAGLVLRIESAQQKHGGSGAFYVLLRRQRG